MLTLYAPRNSCWGSSKANRTNVRVLSLFSGIGGMDLGLERAGFTIAYHAEVDPYCCKVLAKHWPDVPNLGDVTKIDWSELENVEVIVGGYPCQPFSNAGKRQGEKDPRHLWPYFWDAIRTIRPKYALMENVRGHLTLGFGTVLRDLAAIGYDARWDCIPAAAVGAPHLRDRVFIVARPSRTEQRGYLANSNDPGSRDTLFTGWNAPWHGSAFMANTNRKGWNKNRLSVGQESRYPRTGGRGAHSGWDDLAENWKVEPDVGRVAHGIPNRVDRLRGLGNAVVPQVAEYIGRLIMANK